MFSLKWKWLKPVEWTKRTDYKRKINTTAKMYYQTLPFPASNTWVCQIFLQFSIKSQVSRFVRSAHRILFTKRRSVLLWNIWEQDEENVTPIQSLSLKTITYDIKYLTAEWENSLCSNCHSFPNASAVDVLKLSEVISAN